MLRSLVGSEMCIRDRPSTTPFQLVPPLNIGQLNIGTTTLSRTITTSPPTAPPTPSVGPSTVTDSLPSTIANVTYGTRVFQTDAVPSTSPSTTAPSVSSTDSLPSTSVSTQ